MTPAQMLQQAQIEDLTVKECDGELVVEGVQFDGPLAQLIIAREREVLAFLRGEPVDETPGGVQAARILTLNELKTKHPVLKPPVVDGLFREGETANIIADSKIGKSWLAYLLGLSVVMGRPWLGRFDTAPGRVLLIDNELHPENLSYRVPAVGNAMGVRLEDYADEFDVLSLRGNLKSLAQLSIDFDRLPHGKYQLIILDAKYRFLTGSSENDNAAEAMFYNTVDQLSKQTGAAFVLIHHACKGSQSDKKVTDVGAGGGAQSRAADCHLILREHETEGVVVLDAAVRSFKPVDSLALRWEFPLWVPDEYSDPSNLKRQQSRSEIKQDAQNKEADNKILAALLSGPATARQLRSETGLSRERQQRRLDWLTSEGHLASTSTKVRGNDCMEYQIVNTDD